MSSKSLLAHCPPDAVPLRGREAIKRDGEDAHLYRSMFENAVWGIFQSTADGTYLTANPALAQIYGYDSPAEMLAALTDIGRQLYVDAARRTDFISLMKEHGKLSGFEAEVYRRDGSVIWISESCREVRSSTGAFLCYEGTVEEITARKKAEAALSAAKEQAETASRAKTSFLANMSHELRTPLNAVIGFSEIMREELFGPLGDARYREYVADICASGTHLLDLINAILDMTKIESGRMELNEEAVDIRTIASDAARLIADRARERDIAFVINFPEEPIVVLVDRIRLKQVLINLLSNAVKFTPGGGKIVLDARRADDGGCEFVVRDTGIGMNAEELERAVRPFEQVDSSLARRYEGTGLGLTLTKSLVELHGGVLVLQSEPARGTIATVRLPQRRVVQAK